MGAISKEKGKDLAMTAAGAVIGILTKRLLENTLNAQTAVTINPKVLLVGEIVAGGVIGYMWGDNNIAKGASIGIIGASTVQLAQTAGILNGISEITDGIVEFRAKPNFSGLSVTPTVGALLNPYSYPQPGSVGKMTVSQKFAGAGL